MNIRSLSIVLHRWSGLALALFVVLVSASGALLVFRPELDRWLNPDLFVITAGETTLSATQVVQRAVERHSHMRPSEIILPDSLTATWRVMLQALPGSRAAPEMEVFVDPFRGVLLGERPVEGGDFDRRTFFYHLRIFHYKLLVDRGMYRVLGVVALIWLITAAFGIYLGWPRRGAWRRVLSIKLSSGALRALFDAHRSLGMLSAVVLLPILITSLWWNLDFITRPLVHAALPTTPWLQDALSHAGHHASGAQQHTALVPSLDDVLVQACGSAAQLACTRVLFNYHQAQYQVWTGPRKAWTGEWLAPDMNGGGSGIRFFSMSDAAEINSIDVSGAKAGDVYAALQYPLHTGTFFGLPGRLLWLITALVPVLLAVSGVYVWVKRRQRAVIRQHA